MAEPKPNPGAHHLFTSEFHINRQPITLEGRNLAVKKETEQIFVNYNRESGKRLWSPYDLPEDEIAERGAQLSDASVTMLEGFMGVEEYIGDYVKSGLEEFQTRRQRNQHLQWGHEEWRHGKGLERILLSSGRRTEAQIEDYFDLHAKNHWSPDQHKGVNGPLGALVFSSFQEMGTYRDYLGLREQIRTEYELPNAPTPEEKAQGREVGISHGLKIIARDELAHFGLFMPQLLVHMKYFPDDTAAKVQEVKDGFSMPANKILPNRRQFFMAVLRSGVHNRDLVEANVFKPILQSLSKVEPVQVA